MKGFLKYTPIAALAISIFFNVIQVINNSQLKKQYSDQLIPEIQLDYRYFALGNIEKRGLRIKNVGLTLCRDVWVREYIYLIIGDEVYEGLDIPHYHYVSYDGSREKMWDLEKNKYRDVDLAENQILAFNRVHEKFNAQIVTKWEVKYSSKTSKTYVYNEYFYYDFRDRNFKSLESMTGGQKLLNMIHDHMNLLSKNIVKIFDLTSDFEINPPEAYLIDENDDILPLNEFTVLSIDQINNAKYFSAGNIEIQPSDDLVGSIWYKWLFQNGKWSKSFSFTGGSSMTSKPLKLLHGYLAADEFQVYLNNPDTLKFEPVNGALDIKGDLENARIKYLNNVK